MAFKLVAYSQQDPAWKNNLLSNGPDTIGYIGCALTSVAMYASGWGYTETPATLNLKLRSSGGYVGEAIVWGAISKFHPEIQSKGLTLCMNTEAPLAQIDSYLAAGEPVIVEVDYSPDAGLQTHWVLILGKQGSDYLIQDPWPCPPVSQPPMLLSHYSQGQPLSRTIKAVAWFQCSAGASAPAPLPSGTTSTSSTPSSSTTPATPLPSPVATDLVIEVVATATAGIKLHNGPSSTSYADYAEMPGVPLNVIEEKAGALSKLGKSNQWIYVCDPNGHQGYVAAWYVERVSSTPAPAPAPTPSSSTAPSAPSTPASPSSTTGSPSTIPSTGTPPTGAPERFQVVVIQSVGSAGLAVRSQPFAGSDKVNNEKAGARLTVIEPASSALPKIGKTGKWLAVKATNNQRGYVMAQYVQLRN